MKMSKSAAQLFDEILKETKNYRYDYIENLIEKYVKTQDEVVEIHMRNFTVTKSSNYLKRIEEKSFGYLSSYECKNAKKTISYWKKKIILQKRTSFRQYAGAESSYDGFHSTNSKRNCKYLSPGKACKSFQKEMISLNENTFLSEMDSEDDDDVEENETTTLSCEDYSSSLARKKQNKALLTTGNKEHLSINAPKFSDGNLLKSSHCKTLDILMDNLSPANDYRWNNKTLINVDENLAVCLKNIPLFAKKEKIMNHSVFSACNSKSFADYVSSKRIPKLKVCADRMGMSSKIYQDMSKSLHYASKKSTESCRLSVNVVRIGISNENNRVTRSKSLSCASNKSAIQLRDRSNNNCQVNSCYDAKSLTPASSRSTQTSKLTSSDGEIKNNKLLKTNACCGTSNKSTELSKSKVSRNCHTKSLPDASIESCKLSGIEESNKNFTAKSLSNKSVQPTGEMKMEACNAKPLVSPNKSIATAKLKLNDVKKSYPKQICNRMSLSCLDPADIDPLSLKKVSTVKKQNKKTSSLIQSTLAFKKSKSYTEYRNNSQIDDLSLIKNLKNKQRESCKL